MDDQKTRILKALSGLNRPITISALAEKTGLDRHAVARHLDTLELLGKVRKLHVGAAKKYLLTTSIPVSGLIDISSDLILILDPTGVVQYVNNAAIQFLGISAHNIIGEHLKNFNLPLFSHPVITNELRNYTFETACKHQVLYKTDVWFEITIVGFSITQGANLISVIASDISVQKRNEKEVLEAQENLRISEEKYRLIAENSVDVIWTLDPITRKFTFVSPSVERLRGYTVDEVLQQTMEEVMTKESYNLLMALLPDRITKFMRGDETHKGDRHRVDQPHKNGTIIPTEVVSSFITDNCGNIISILGVSRDISKQEQMKEHLRESQEKFRMLAENIGDIVWIVNAESERFEYVNPASIEFGYYPDEVIGHRYAEIMDPEEYLSLSRELNQHIFALGSANPPDKTRRQEIILNHKNGNPIIVQMVYTLQTDKNGRVTHIIGVTRDISKAKRTEKELITAYQDLLREHEKIFREGRTSSRNEANKLSEILLFTKQAMENGNSEPDLKEILSRINDAVSDLENLIRSTQG
ncbi:MAG: PAS domain S-box protein [Methanobacteriota archaeon]